ncbi:MAG: cbb3-type cytochrome c oxidase subunit 3 [Chlorobiaceae bacterium]|nr:cbb3-type cytochrome c oxidase subunit 3 [Chlorobiaceae bacterium]
MNFQSIAYTAFTFALAAVMAGIIAYYFNPARRKDVEEPKYRMLRDDE